MFYLKVDRNEGLYRFVELKVSLNWFMIWDSLGFIWYGKGVYIWNFIFFFFLFDFDGLIELGINGIGIENGNLESLFWGFDFKKWVILSIWFEISFKLFRD